MQYPSLTLHLFLPSFFLLAAAGSPAFMDAWTMHREAFGSENYYLTVDYTSNPEGVLASPEQGIRFSGSLVTEKGEFRVHGVRKPEGQFIAYRMQSAAGNFLAKFPRQSACPRDLVLGPLSTGTGLPTETLRSGLCL